MPEDLRKLSQLSWGYERRTTTATVAAVSVLCGAAAHAMLPADGSGPRVAPVLAAGAGAYVVLRLGHASGLSKRLKHDWLDRFGGDVDDAQTWLLGTLGGLGTLAALREVRRLPERLRR